MRAKDITFGSLRYQLSPRRRHLNDSNKVSERVIQGIGTTVRRHQDERSTGRTRERTRRTRRKDRVRREFQGIKIPFAYTQTTVRLYPNGHSPILKSDGHIFEWPLNMEDTWKRKRSLPYMEIPLNTGVSGIYMEDGRESITKKYMTHLRLLFNINLSPG